MRRPHARATCVANCCWFERGLPPLFYLLFSDLILHAFLIATFFYLFRLVLTTGVLWRGGWMTRQLTAVVCFV